MSKKVNLKFLTPIFMIQRSNVAFRTQTKPKGTIFLGSILNTVRAND
jgi:hypothetical protein